MASVVWILNAGGWDDDTKSVRGEQKNNKRVCNAGRIRLEGVKRGRDGDVVGWERRGRGVDVIRGGEG